ncbi:MAG: hypothetical protein ACKN85_17680, partial [Pirellula sp.]
MTTSIMTVALTLRVRRLCFLLLASSLAGAFCAGQVIGGVSLTSAAPIYTQDFNTLSNANGSSASTGIPSSWGFVESGTGANT